MNHFHDRVVGSRSRQTAACEAMVSANGSAASGANTGCRPTRRIVAAEIPEYPSAPAGQIASPIRSCTEAFVPEY